MQRKHLTPCILALWPNVIFTNKVFCHLHLIYHSICFHSPLPLIYTPKVISKSTNRWRQEIWSTAQNRIDLKQEDHQIIQISFCDKFLIFSRVHRRFRCTVKFSTKYLCMTSVLVGILHSTLQLKDYNHKYSQSQIQLLQ